MGCLSDVIFLMTLVKNIWSLEWSVFLVMTKTVIIVVVRPLFFIVRYECGIFLSF